VDALLAAPADRRPPSGHFLYIPSSAPAKVAALPGETVSTHLMRVKEKLGARTTGQALVFFDRRRRAANA
jgi:hypothetical protein